MNIFGVGNLEIIWILLIALVLLGPGRMVDAARSLGKFWREAQHVLRAAADAATVSLDAPPPRSAPREPLAEPEDAVARGEQEEVHPHAPDHPHPDPLRSRERGPGGDGDEQPEAR
ncbi:MAG: twin-arginine translocase TatA/TatE family subunit [Chloroflexota bacterium]|nr:twin-arginine translocase TatA/TatE family subunit [Chloroflexota bacterium]MDE2885529.1 twin-arginine translocase TatA/TatE family subunit [Chloroflexota bacterium]